VTIGLPTVIGRDGARGVLMPAMSEDERNDFDRSVQTLRDAVAGLRTGGG
jgi:malate/lactate dehydrogenase